MRLFPSPHEFFFFFFYSLLQFCELVKCNSLSRETNCETGHEHAHQLISTLCSSSLRIAHRIDSLRSNVPFPNLNEMGFLHACCRVHARTKRMTGSNFTASRKRKIVKSLFVCIFHSMFACARICCTCIGPRAHTWSIAEHQVARHLFIVF